MKSQKTKGDRLNWTPLKEVKTVQLDEDMTKGKRVKLTVSKGKTDKRLLLVP
jgi:hypothetical protein